MGGGGERRRGWEGKRSWSEEVRGKVENGRSRVELGG